MSRRCGCQTFQLAPQNRLRLAASEEALDDKEDAAKDEQSEGDGEDRFIRMHIDARQTRSRSGTLQVVAGKEHS